MTKLYWFVVGERLILHQNRTLLKTRSWIISSDWQNNVQSRQLFCSCIYLFCLWCCWYFVFHSACPVFPVCGLKKKKKNDKWCSGTTIIFMNPNPLIGVNTLVYIRVRVGSSVYILASGMKYWIFYMHYISHERVILLTEVRLMK